MPECFIMTQTFDFDQRIDRHGVGSTKWDKYAGRDILPLWVADMDFASPPCVIDALHTRIDHGVFGYTEPGAALNQTIIDHLDEIYDWEVQPDWILWLPGLVSALNVVARTFCPPGQQVVSATPVYPPFLSAPRYQGCDVVRVPMVESGGRWAWDLDRLDASLSGQVRLLSLCNPHNPVGRVFDRHELTALAERCLRHDLVLCSDEIHCGLVLDAGARHMPIATLSPEIAARSITLMSASKTFNLPGLGCAFAIVPDASLRARIKQTSAGIVPRVNALGFTATEAAYRYGGTWQRALVAYLRANRDHLMATLASLPGIRVYPVQATYLAWIDARDLPVADPAAFFESAGVGLSDGADFGAPGFVRLNFGCPRAVLDEALRRVTEALRSAS